MATKVKFVGNPWGCRVRHQEYNLCAGMMPRLKQSKRSLSEEDIQELQPILDHIKDCLCAGNQQDYTNLLAWLAHIMQDPAEKTGWCPVTSHPSCDYIWKVDNEAPDALSTLTKDPSSQVLISDQGVGKGMVFSSLMMGIMQELGLHVTNFDSVVNRFNDELSMKSYVLSL